MKRVFLSICSILVVSMLCVCCGTQRDQKTQQVNDASESNQETSSSTAEATTEAPTKEPTEATTEAPTTEAPITEAPVAPTEAPAGDSIVGDQNTPFAKHGALHVDGANLVDQHGEKYQLYGMSTHGIGWFPQYVNYDTFTTLRDDWNTNCIRLAMYTAENQGYCTDGDQESLKQLVKNGIDYATELDMYAIVDWHVLKDETPLLYKDQAISFFDEISKTYANQDNIIYEICNEPNGSTTWEDVKAYAEEVIPVIRANDANAIILVGTPTWSQDVDKACANPLDFDNIMYVVHFYAATHTDWLRDRVKTCIDAGLPIFVSEFGTCDASGNGAIDYAQAESWKEFIEMYNLSYFCWNLANNQESSSVIAADCSKTSGWEDTELSDQGKWIVAWFRSEENSSVQ